MTHPVNVYRPIAQNAGSPVAATVAQPQRDDRFGAILYLYGGRVLVGSAFIALLGTSMAFTGGEGRAFSVLVALYGFYGVLLGLGTLGRLRIAWVLLVISKVLGLLLALAAAGLGSVAAVVDRFHAASGQSSLGGTFLSAAFSLLILILLLDRKAWFYR